MKIFLHSSCLLLWLTTWSEYFLGGRGETMMQNWVLSYDGVVGNMSSDLRSISLLSFSESSASSFSQYMAEMFKALISQDSSQHTSSKSLRMFEYDHTCRVQRIQPFGVQCNVDIAASRSQVPDHLITARVLSFLYENQKDEVLARIDVSLSSSHSSSNAVTAVLSEAVNKLDELYGSPDYSPVWSIQERESATQQKQRLESSSTSTAYQTETEKKASSINVVMLKNADMRKRLRIDEERNLVGPQVWQYEEVGMSKPIRSIFNDRGQLVASTGVAGHAHVEALVHPAMVAHLSPKRIAVLSETPIPLVHEILKHKTVEHISVIGADPTLVQMIQDYLPEWDDCSFLSDSSSFPSCFSQPIINVVTEDIRSWLVKMNEQFTYIDYDDYYDDGFEMDCNQTTAFFNPDCTFSHHPAFDIMLMEVSQRKTDEWLDMSLQRLWHSLLRPESISVVNAGSAYPLMNVPLEGKLSSRDLLFRQASRTWENGGIASEALTSVYEEPLSRPFPSTFLVTINNNQLSYNRFFRRSPPSHDLDLIAKLHPGISTERFGRPTWVYDGPTHVSYLNVPLVWENWYCSSTQGRDSYGCKELLPKWYDVSHHHSASEIQRHPVKGRALHATADIPEGDFVLSYDTALNLQLDGYQWLALEQFVKDFPDATRYSQLRDFFRVYGYENEASGYSGWGVSIACNNTFINHGCTPDEVNTGYPLELYENEDGDDNQFSPLESRRAEMTSLVVALRDIFAGEEITEDYLSFREDDSETLQEHLHFLEDMCHDGVGFVSPNDGLRNN